MNTFTRAALTVLVGLVIWFLPHTEAIKPEGWHLLAIFTATIVGFILGFARNISISSGDNNFTLSRS